MVLGGQIFAKSLRGFREGDVPGLLEKEGIAMAVLIFVLPLVFIALFDRVLPVFEPADEQDRASAENRPG